ncbi:hypothetical protein PR202_gb29036 [Eleusine coracana subsp. coracana]|uniref:F-box domain-containing protein n=1 Tax=Eleusine coracana subsp. coracana TaxID=191504 RepID=A0AAV5G0B4_ELECO|nr:hypothetical protein PR202_gb29036 [Eleusine coracana subsp. coracana]
MEEVFSDADLASMSPPMRALTQSVYTALPSPRVDTTDRLYCAAAADRVDRISFLPPWIRRNIVSRLPIKDAVRTTVLSTRCMDEIAAVVSNVLRSHLGRLWCVHLTATPMANRRDQTVEWLHHLAQRRVEKLFFINNPKKMCLDVPLPLAIFDCEFLLVLYLGFVG